MTPERWQKVNEIFHSACEQPSPEADAFARTACGDDREMYSEVRRMLETARPLQAHARFKPQARLFEEDGRPLVVTCPRQRAAHLVERAGLFPAAERAL